MPKPIGDRLRSIGKKLVQEVKAVWILTAYFVAGFTLILLMQNLLLADKGVEQVGYHGAMVLVLLIGKVVVVTEKLSFAKRFRHRPHILHVAYSTVLFTLVVLVIGSLEKVVKKLIHGETTGIAFSAVYSEANLSKFLAVTVALFIMFGLLFFVREVNHLLGPGVFLRALFRPPEAR